MISSSPARSWCFLRNYSALRPAGRSLLPDSDLAYVPFGAKAEKLVASKCLPVRPQYQTSVIAFGTSALCQHQKFASHWMTGSRVSVEGAEINRAELPDTSGSALCANARAENALLTVDVAARWGTRTWFLYQRAGGRRPAELR
jgi:hypothetical protein